MLTVGQARVLRSNINSYVAFMLVGSFALGAILIVCQVAFGENPLANAFAPLVASEF